LADYGYLPYANTIETTLENLQKRPDMVRRFVRAVVQGWQSYLEDPQPAFNAIQRLNPEMKDGLMNYGFEQMKNMGLVDSGDAATLGIGAMTDARWLAFYESLVEGKLFSGDLNIKEAYTLEFLPGKGT
jgi:NitT/TauT family transport system substrate-binding protein